MHMTTIDNRDVSGIFVCEKNAHLARWTIDPDHHYGHIINRSSLAEDRWHIDGFLQQKNALFLIGERIDVESCYTSYMRCLQHAKEAEFPRECIKLIKVFLDGYEIFSREDSVYLPACFFNKDQLLILHESIQRKLMHYSPLVAQNSPFCCLAPRFFHNRRAINFAIASLLYALFTSHAPFEVKKNLMFTQTVQKSLFARLSELSVYNACAKSEQKAILVLESALEGSDKDCSDSFVFLLDQYASLEKAIRPEQNTIQDIQSKHIRRLLLKRKLSHWVVPLVSCAFLLTALITVVIPIIQRVYAPSPFQQYSAFDIVSLYFDSINNLDMDAILAIAKKRATRSIRNSLSTLVVMERLAILDDNILPPMSIVEWEKQQQNNPPEVFLYGVKVGAILPQTYTDSEASFSVSYDEWHTRVMDEIVVNERGEDQARRAYIVTVMNKQALIKLEKKQDAWIIDTIESQQKNP